MKGVSNVLSKDNHEANEIKTCPNLTGRKME